MNRKTLILLTFMFLLATILGGWFLIFRDKKIPEGSQGKPVVEEDATKNSTVSIIDDGYHEKPIPQPNLDIKTWKLYKNAKYGFEVKIPSDWEVDIQESSSRERSSRRVDDSYSIKELVNDPGSSVSISFGPVESIPGGRLFVLSLISFENSDKNNTDDLTVIQNYFHQKNEKEADINRFVYEKIVFKGVSAFRMCFVSGCNIKGVKDYEQIAFFRKGILWKIGEANEADDSIEEAFPLFLKSFRFIN